MWYFTAALTDFLYQTHSDSQVPGSNNTCIIIMIDSVIYLHNSCVVPSSCQLMVLLIQDCLTTVDF